MKQYWKVFKQILLPIILILLPLIFGDVIINLITDVYENYSGNEIDLGYDVIKVILIIAFWISVILFNVKFEREFLNGDVYGDVPFIFYYLAKALGYRYISLIRKPYKVQFTIIRKDLFRIKDHLIDEDNNVKITINKNDFKFSNNLRECNLVIADTFPIVKEQLPEIKKDLDTIIIEREKSKINDRIYSKELMCKVQECTELIQKTGAKINLYLTTNTKHTELIVKDVFMKRSNCVVEVFQQEECGTRKFKVKGKRMRFL